MDLKESQERLFDGPRIDFLREKDFFLVMKLDHAEENSMSND